MSKKWNRRQKKKVTWQCPECGSSRLDQYRMPYGAMWCTDCGFRIEDKNAIPNPFLVAEKENQAAPRQTEDDQPMLGEQLRALQEIKRNKKK